jgi:ribulose 1,5-bisphosphate carboxylase large subunit-like protein
LVSVRFGKEYLGRFKGPSFGLEGIYKKLKIPLAPIRKPDQ